MKKCTTVFSLFLVLCLCMSMSTTSYAQGITTAAISGIVTDKAGQPLPGANVVATHGPSGSKYGISTRVDGRFNLQNLRVGGPYDVTVTFIGYKSQSREGITLELSQNLRLDFAMEEGAVEAPTIEIIGQKGALMNSSRTGAGTNVSREEIEIFPTIARSFQDYQKFTPQFFGNNAVGRNNRFNNIQIDGSVYNDLFGLASSGTPGGQAGTTPISLDAIDEFQVVVAPYDVRQGSFTGGSINAVTRGGTNSYHASAFGFFRNQGFVGKSPDTSRTKFPDFKEYQTGFRVGGPIIDQKLFFFLNGEITNRDEPQDIQFTGSGVTGPNVSKMNIDSVKKFVSILQSKYGYDPAGYGVFPSKTKSGKFFARLDYNLADNHKLSLRNNFVDATDDNLVQSITRFYLENSNYVFGNQTNSTVAQLNSTFGNEISNELIVGYTRIRDKRTTPGSPFPFVRVFQGTGLDLNAGTENFSAANRLDQDIIEVTDNFTYFLGPHVLTAGTHNEIFGFENLFIRDIYGNYEFRNLQDLDRGYVNRYQASYSLTSNPQQTAKWNAIQYGFYAQDEWAMMPSLKVTIGLRADIPTFPDKPAFNAKVDSVFGSQGYGTDKIPSGNLLFSPRLGFNWDVIGDRTTQVRGGVGIFSGRVPFVWISNAYSNTGVEFARVDARPTTVGFFKPDPLNQPKPGTTPGLSPVATSEINLTDPDFKLPQVLRFNVAGDHQLPLGIVGTLEFIYSKSLNDVLYQDINLGPQLSTLAGDGRSVYGKYDSTRKSFTAGKVNAAYTNVILMKNTSEGYQYTFTVQLQRQLADNFLGSIAYTYGRSFDQNSVLSSQAVSQWRFNHVPGDPNNPPLAPSAFDRPHRLLAAVSYRYEWIKDLSTTLSIFYDGYSGRSFSYVYDGDVNGDGQTENDLIYIPNDQNDIILKTNNWQQLDAYIESDDYLKDSRGNIVGRMGGREPFVNQLDMRITQDIPVISGHKFQITVDVLNFLNLLNGDWGHQRTVSNQRDRLLKFEGLDGATKKPIFSFTNKTDPFQFDDLSSRWQMQIGLRYTL